LKRDARERLCRPQLVGEVEERLQKDVSSNAGNGEKEDLEIVSCRGCGRAMGA
jgi:hypothetical protein